LLNGQVVAPDIEVTDGLGGWKKLGKGLGWEG